MFSFNLSLFIVCFHCKPTATSHTIHFCVFRNRGTSVEGWCLFLCALFALNHTVMFLQFSPRPLASLVSHQWSSYDSYQSLSAVCNPSLALFLNSISVKVQLSGELKGCTSRGPFTVC